MASELPYDLAGIRHPADVLGFVRRWRFLHSAEEDEEAEATVEEFETEALHIGYVLYLYSLIAQPGSPPRTAPWRSIGLVSIRARLGTAGNGRGTLADAPLPPTT